MSGVVILAARRTAVVPRGGGFKMLDAATLAASVIQAVLADAGLTPEAVDDVILGNALSAGGNVARVAGLAAGLPERVPAATLDTQCCAGLDAIRFGAARILSGEARFVIAGGAESFSRAPLRAHRPTEPGAPPDFYSRPAFTPWPDRDPDLTLATACLARRLGLTRVAQEAFARDSHGKALAAPTPTSEIAPLMGIAHDPFARTLSPAACARLPPLAGEAAFAITAATAAVEADAAAVLLLAAEDAVPQSAPFVRYVAGRATGGDPSEPALVPVEAVRQLLAATATDITDIDHVELMEAYAAQVLATIDALGLDPGRVNSGGGALARGHPIGASGAILAVRAYHRLRQAGRGHALCAIAGAGGLASTLLLQGVHADAEPRAQYLPSGQTNALLYAYTHPMMPDAIPVPARLDPQQGAVPALGTHLARALSANLDKIEEAIKEPDPARMIHEARKAMKEYRALLRLVRTPAAKASRMETARVARTLSAARDLTAARDALALLSKDGLIETDEERAAGSALAPAGGEPAEDAARRETLAHFLTDTRRLHDASLLADAKGADVLDGLKRGYRKARAGSFAHAEDVHETRKGVVAHRYQMSFYDAIPGCAGERRAAKAQALRDLLGAYQDAHTLDRLLDASGSTFTDALRVRIRSAIADEQKALLKKAKRKHETLFAPSPSAFVKSLVRA